MTFLAFPQDVLSAIAAAQAAAQAYADAKAGFLPTSRVVNSTDETTIQPGDIGAMLKINRSTPNSIYVPAHSSDLPVGSTGVILIENTGLTTITNAPGATIYWGYDAGLVFPLQAFGQDAMITWVKRSIDKWQFNGSLKLA